MSFFIYDEIASGSAPGVTVEPVKNPMQKNSIARVNKTIMPRTATTLFMNNHLKNFKATTVIFDQTQYNVTVTLLSFFLFSQKKVYGW